MTILFSKEDITLIKKITSSHFPREACGLLACKPVGRNKIHLKLYPTENRYTGLLYFGISNDDIERHNVITRKINSTLIGCFHSHMGPARPSRQDIENAKNTPYKYWLIYSVAFRKLNLFYMGNVPTRIRLLICD